MNIIYLILTTIIITVFIAQSEQISTNSTSIVLQAITNDDLFDFTAQVKKIVNTKSITSAQIYSNQLNDDTISRYFLLVNKTNLIKSDKFSRYGICSNMKYCENLVNNTDQTCVLNLNLIFYLNSKQNHVNKIQSTKLYLIVSDFSSSQLQFERELYEFNLTLNQHSFKTDSTELSVGSVQAHISNDSDLNLIVKYFLEFNDQDKVDYNQLFQIDMNIGHITINREYLANYNKNSSFEFFVNAVSQCSLGQKPMRNRTLVRVNLEQTESTYIFRIRNLIETKRLSNSIECIRLKESELSGELNQSSIALAQIIVENDMGSSIQISELENDLKLFAFQPNNTGFNQLSKDSLTIQHLVDNIYVIYLLKTANFEQIFLNDVYKLQLRVAKSILDIYLCIDSSETSNLYTDSFSLVQFVENSYHLNAPIQIDSFQHSSKAHDSILLEAYHLATPNISIKFYLDDDLSSRVFNLSLIPIDSTKSLLSYSNSVLSQESVIEKLQYELISIAFDSSSIQSNQDLSGEPNRFSQLKRVVYNDLTRQALNSKKFLRFTSKILINTITELNINDSTTSFYNNHTNVYSFYVNSVKSAQNTVIAYLPNVYDLNTKYSLSFNTKQIEYLYYSFSAVAEQESNSTRECFRLNRFDGVLSFITETPANCFNNVSESPIKLRVYLNSLLDREVNVELTQIWIYDIGSEKNQFSTSLIYDANDLLHDSRNKIKPASINMFSLSFLIDVDKHYNCNYVLPSFVKLVDLITYFKPNLSQVENQFDYKTVFEFIQLDEHLSDIFLLDTKMNAIYLNVSKSIVEKSIQFKCYHIDLVAKNYIHLSSIKRKLTSFDSFKLNLCFFNNETISYRDFIANKFTYRSLVLPFQNENSMTGFQQLLIKNYSESSNLILFIIILVAVAILVMGFILTGAYFRQNKNRDDETDSQSKRNTISSHSYPEMNRYYSASINTATTGSTDISPTVLLKIRNDLSFERSRVI